MSNTTIGIIGGGYIGAATAIHLARCSHEPLNICIVETSSTLGGGVAFSAPDRDHRLNAPTGIHFLYPENTESFTEWHETSGAKAGDPESIAVDGRVYARRADFGAYMAAELTTHQKKNPSRSTIKHYQDTAISLSKSKGDWCIELLSGTNINSKIVLFTPCNLRPAIPAQLQKLAAHPAMFTNPWDLARFTEIASDAKVLIIGTGLTMADVASTLLRDGPKRKIIALSRRGLLPQGQRSHPPSQPLWVSLNRPVPAFVERHGKPKTALAILRAFRADIARLNAQGIEWHVVFDELRDAARELWPSLPLAEQQCYFRHLSPWYETHRFRLPPQVADKLAGYQRDGRLVYRAGHLINVNAKDNSFQVGLRTRGHENATTENFDAVINCTGPERDPKRAGNPFMAHLVSNGLATPSPFGLGLEVDKSCQSLSINSVPVNNLFILGPLTRNRFGEINGIPTIVKQIHQITQEITNTAFLSIDSDASW
jgi:uncharacterized NAD(P)/FAD-binding protein YdhS